MPTKAAELCEYEEPYQQVSTVAYTLAETDTGRQWSASEPTRRGKNKPALLSQNACDSKQGRKSGSLNIETVAWRSCPAMQMAWDGGRRQGGRRKTEGGGRGHEYHPRGSCWLAGQSLDVLTLYECYGKTDQPVNKQRCCLELLYIDMRRLQCSVSHWKEVRSCQSTT